MLFARLVGLSLLFGRGRVSGMDFECAVKRREKSILPTREQGKPTQRPRRGFLFAGGGMQIGLASPGFVLGALLFVVISICSQLQFKDLAVAK